MNVKHIFTEFGTSLGITLLSIKYHDLGFQKSPGVEILPFWALKNYYVIIWCVSIHRNPRTADSIHLVYVHTIPSGPLRDNWGHNQAIFLNLKALKMIMSHFNAFRSMTICNRHTLFEQCAVLICFHHPFGTPLADFRPSGVQILTFWHIGNYFGQFRWITIHRNPKLVESIHLVHAHTNPSGPLRENWGHKISKKSVKISKNPNPCWMA